VGKSGVLEHKSGNISETRKDRGNATMEDVYYNNSPTLFRTVPSPTPYGLLFPKIGVCNPHPKLQSVSGTGKATDFKFGRYIHRVHRNKSRIKIMEKKGSVGVSRDCPNF